MIQEVYCSFEVAKLLKEKGFNVPIWTCYIENEISHYDYISSNSELIDGVISAPTHQMAMKWLREVHGIFIGVSLCERYENKIDTDTTIMFFFELLNLEEKQLINGFSQEYAYTYEDAVESALKYVLKNLI